MAPYNNLNGLRRSTEAMKRILNLRDRHGFTFATIASIYRYPSAHAARQSYIRFKRYLEKEDGHNQT